MKSLISSMVGCFASGGCDFVAMVGIGDAEGKRVALGLEQLMEERK